MSISSQSIELNIKKSLQQYTFFFKRSRNTNFPQTSEPHRTAFFWTKQRHLAPDQKFLYFTTGWFGANHTSFLATLIKETTVI